MASSTCSSSNASNYLEIVRYMQDVIFSSQITSPEVEYFQTTSLRVTSESAGAGGNRRRVDRQLPRRVSDQSLRAPCLGTGRVAARSTPSVFPNRQRKVAAILSFPCACPAGSPRRSPGLGRSGSASFSSRSSASTSIAFVAQFFLDAYRSGVRRGVSRAERERHSKRVRVAVSHRAVSALRRLASARQHDRALPARSRCGMHRRPATFPLPLPRGSSSGRTRAPLPDATIDRCCSARPAASRRC